jgi:Protein of unknown function (DUF433)
MACIIPHDRIPLILNTGFILHNKADDTTILLDRPYPQSISQFGREGEQKPILFAMDLRTKSMRQSSATHQLRTNFSTERTTFSRGTDGSRKGHGGSEDQESDMATNRIEINPAVMLGKPVIRGTRIPVELRIESSARGRQKPTCWMPTRV